MPTLSRTRSRPRRLLKPVIISGLLLSVLVAVISAAWLWFCTHRALKATLPGHGLAFSPDGKTLAICGLDREIRLLDLASGKERILNTHDEVAAVVFFDNKTLAAANLDGSLRLWDTETRLLREAFLLKKKTPFVEFSPNGQFLVSLGSGIWTLWSVATGNVVGEFDNSAFRYLVTSTDGKLIASLSSSGGEVSLWDLAGNKELRRFGDDGTWWRLQLKFRPDGKELAAVIGRCGTKKVELWNLATGELQIYLESKEDTYLSSIAFTPDGEVLAGSTMPSAIGGKLIFWNTNSGQRLATLFFFPSATSLVFSPDGKTLASVHRDDGTVRLWDSAKLIPQR